MGGGGIKRLRGLAMHAQPLPASEEICKGVGREGGDSQDVSTLNVTGRAQFIVSLRGAQTLW